MSEQSKSYTSCIQKRGAITRIDYRLSTITLSLYYVENITRLIKKSDHTISNMEIKTDRIVHMNIIDITDNQYRSD